jgi:hypothetical protein
MRACRHYEYDIGDETDIVASDGFEWNGWVEVWRGDQKIISEFRSGIMLEYLQHLAEHPECCKEIGWSRRDVKARLREIEAEWKKAVDP